MIGLHYINYKHTYIAQNGGYQLDMILVMAASSQPYWKWLLLEIVESTSIWNLTKKVQNILKLHVYVVVEILRLQIYKPLF